MEIFIGQGIKAHYINSSKFLFEYSDFNINSGQCICVRGGTGSGKSTLLNALFGQSFKGNLYYDRAELLGKDIKAYGKDLYKHISYMPQFSQNALNPTIKISQHIKDVMKNTEEPLEYKNIMESLRLDMNILDKYSHELSGGMKQRVVLMLGFIKKPRLFVLDEPSTAIDAITLKLMLEYLMKRKSEGNSIIIATHDKGFSSHIADKSIEIQTS